MEGNNMRQEDYLYHYTSIESFQGMMKNYRESKDNGNIVFWASNIMFMNDPTEMKIGYDAIMTFLPNIENDIEKVKRISSLITDYHINGWSEEQTCNFFKDNSFNIHFTPFVLSFSSQPSSIPMWSIYGKRGHGICLYFDRKCLMNYFNTSEDNGLLVPLDYEYNIEKSIYNQTYKDTIKKEYEKYLKRISNKNSSDGFFKEKLEAIRSICFFLSPYFKNNLFKYEKEVRYIKHTFAINEINYRYSKNRLIIPYIEIPIPIAFLKAVELGPCTDLKLQRKNIQSELDITFSGITINIIDSNVPLRDL